MSQIQTVTSDANHTAVERLIGFNFWETASAAAVFELRQGSVTGTVVRRISLAADESVEKTMSKPSFLPFPGGCYVKVVSGAVSGVLDYP